MICVTQFLCILFLLKTKTYQFDEIFEVLQSYCLLDSLNLLRYGNLVNKTQLHVFNMSSSVFCFGELMKDRECRFQNLCYRKDTSEYIFLHGPETRFYGLEHARNDPALVDLSSVANHTAKYFTYTDIHTSSLDFVDFEYVAGPSVLFHRFNSENLMHVLHDDLMPVYHTQRKYFPTSKDDVTYIIMDGRPDGPFYDLYTMLLSRIKLKKHFTKTLTCFEDVIVGVSKTTTWYHYGFRTPQGLINRTFFPSTEISYFRNDFKLKIGSGNIPATEQLSKYIVLFSRSLTRKIVNEVTFMMKLSKHYKAPVHVVNLETDPLSHIVSLVSHAHIVIGVHGAHLITSLFMQPSSILIEIFPFGVPAVNYTPYKTLANLLRITYIAWENKDEKNTVTHENWSSDYGGITTFSNTIQDDIINTKVVPLHICCKNPYWLFRIYQDTIVDVDDFINAVDSKVDSKNGNENPL